MAVSLEFRFKGKEAKVLAEVERDGIKAVMKQYGIKNQYGFSKWIERHRDPVLSKLAGLNGGEKRLWMRNHRDTIIDLLEIFGESFVMEKFHISHEAALTEMMSQTNEPYFRKLSKGDRLDLRVNEALAGIKDIVTRLERIETHLQIHDVDIAEDRQTINELLDFVKKFSDNTSKTIARVLLEPLLQRTLQDSCGDMELPIKDPLALDFPKKLELNPPKDTPETGLEIKPEVLRLKQTYLENHPMAGE
jgi:hypothetical protein